MRYFRVIYVSDLSDGFAGKTNGPFIRIGLAYKKDIGLHEHEKNHVRQWYAALALWLLLCILLALLVSMSLWPLCCLAPVLHQLLYKIVRPYRRWCEVRAYRKQIKTGGYASHAFAVTALVEKYDLGLSIDEARNLLFN